MDGQSIDSFLKTSQQREGAYSLPEGSASATAPAVQYGSETSGAPGPVTEPIKGEIIKIDATKTSQTDRDLPEGS